MYSSMSMQGNNNLADKNIIITGIGGQKVLLSARVLANAISNQGYKVIYTQRFRMAIKEASVISHIRVGNVYSPEISLKGCDVMIGLEGLETQRLIGYLTSKSIVLLNNCIVTPTMNCNNLSIEKIINDISKITTNIVLLDASNISKAEGYPDCMNFLMLGAFAALNIIPVKKEMYIQNLNQLDILKFSRHPTIVFKQGFKLGIEYINTKI